MKRLTAQLSAAALCLTIVCPGIYAADTPDKSDTSAADTTAKAPKKRPFLSRLSVGGYGEVAYSRNFYSDNVNRYSHAADYRNAPSHGRFDIPHVVIMLGYDFGRGWTLGSEIEFEHGGTESAVEIENEEVGEYEKEIERGGEVALEQFWIQKSFCPQFNIRAGHQVVPVGETNAHHLPTEFFTVYRPEGESELLPCTWHQTGIEVWGRVGAWRYELMGLAGLNSLHFSKDKWINGGAASAFEFSPANKYAVAARIDNYSIPGLRLSVSGYYGHSFNNTQMADNGKYKSVKGAVAIGAFGLHYQGAGWIVRANADYGHLTDADIISNYNRGQSSTSPYKRTHVGKGAWTAGTEAGYDLLRFFPGKHPADSHLYLFGRYEYYDAYLPTANAPTYTWTERHRIAAGINYYPLKRIVIKAEFSERLLHSQYNNEPSFNIGIAYSGFFL